jgi:hypothetical protein
VGTSKYEYYHSDGNNKYYRSDGINEILETHQKKMMKFKANGVKLNLDTGNFDAYNLSLRSENVLINSQDSDKPYFVIKSDDGNNLFYVGNNQSYLQSSNYKNNDTGMRINLSTGNIDTKNI